MYTGVFGNRGPPMGIGSSFCQSKSQLGSSFSPRLKVHSHEHQRLRLRVRLRQDDNIVSMRILQRTSVEPILCV